MENTLQNISKWCQNQLIIKNQSKQTSHLKCLYNKYLQNSPKSSLFTLKTLKGYSQWLGDPKWILLVTPTQVPHSKIPMPITQICCMAFLIHWLNPWAFRDQNPSSSRVMICNFKVKMPHHVMTALKYWFWKYVSFNNKCITTSFPLFDNPKHGKVKVRAYVIQDQK